MGRVGLRDRFTRSTNWPVWLGRASWQAKNVTRCWVAGILSPFHDAQQWTGFVATCVTAYGAFASGIPQAMIQQLDSLAVWQGTLLSALPIWISVNLMFAFFKARRQEAEAGTWFGPKFVYNEPLLLAAVRWTPADNGTWKQIDVRGPESNSFVMLHIEHYPATDRVRASVVHVWNQPPIGSANGLQRQSIGTRVNNGRLWVVAESQPGTVPVTLRIYCHSFELGKGGVNV